MKIVCAQCTAILGEREPFDEDSISHAVCLKCKDKVLKKLTENKIEERTGKEVRKDARI